MTAIGKAKVDWISDDIWAVSDMEQKQFIAGREGALLEGLPLPR